MLQQISESELTLMQIIWQNEGHALYSQIMEQLAAQQNDWKKNTVLTLLSRLVEKGYLRTSKIGRRNEYAKNLICALLQQEALSAEEVHEIECFWRQEVKTK